MGEVRISVVIPVYNRPKMVKRAVRSVLKQTRPPEELIIVDDGSTDATPETLTALWQEAPDLIRVERHEENRGVSAARNTGIRRGTSGWIALLDSDDTWKPEKLERQERYHRAHPELLISQCNEIWIRDGERVNKRDIHRKREGRYFTDSLKRCLVTPSAVMIHRRIFRHIGYFDTDLPVCEDYDLWLRVLVRYPIGLLDEPLVIRYAGHPDQLSAKHWGMDRWRVAAMEKHLEEDLPEDWKLALYQELIAKLQVLYQGAAKRDKSSAEIYRKKIDRYSQGLKEVTA